MFTTFTLLTAVGVGLWLALSWGLARRFDRSLSIPQALAGAFLVLASLPDWLKPLPFPFPFSVTLGLLLPDFLTRRK